MSKLMFTKMHGLGNDFIVIDATVQPFELPSSDIRRLADRHFGVGFDQLLVVEPARDREADFRYRIFNADGGEVEQCGNGARCFVRFVRDRGLTDKDCITVETAAGLIRPCLQADGQVRVDMGVPRTAPAEIPFQAEAEAGSYPLLVDDQRHEIGAVSMGNPHAVLWVDDVDSAPVHSLGARIQASDRFPRGVNVGFMQALTPERVRLRVFERGVGETLACGTGACAAVVSGRIQCKLGERVRVDLPGGSLWVQWQGAGQPVYMTGPAEIVYEGQIAI